MEKIPKTFKFIDEKTADGNTGSGNVRSGCEGNYYNGVYVSSGYVSYDIAIADKANWYCAGLIIGFGDFLALWI